MKFEFDPNRSPGIVKMVAVMKTLGESKGGPGMAEICAVMREALTHDEIAGLPVPPEVQVKGRSLMIA